MNAKQKKQRSLTNFLIPRWTLKPDKKYRKSEIQTMQTTLEINDQLIAEAAKLANTDNQSQVIEMALSEFIKNHAPTIKHDVRDLVGKVSIDPDYDYKKLRIGEL